MFSSIIATYNRKAVRTTNAGTKHIYLNNKQSVIQNHVSCTGSWSGLPS